MVLRLRKELKIKVCDSSELLANAQLAFSEENYSRAIELCNQIPVDDICGISAIVLAGNAYLVQSKFQEAETLFIKAIEIESHVGEHYFNLGNSLFGQRRLSEAMQQYANAIHFGCKDDVMQKIYYIVGIINQLDGKSAEALVNYAKSEAVPGANVDRADILLKRIQIYVEQNNLEKAENCALQLKLLVPGEFKSYQLLFQLYLEQRKVDMASAILEEAEKYCEKNIDTATELAFDKALLSCFKAEHYPNQQTQYYNDALEILEQLERDDSLKVADRCEAVITRADIKLKLGLYDEALNLVQSVANRSLPELREYIERANYIIIKCLSHNKDYSEVLQYAAKLKNSDNIFYSHYGYYAEAYAEKQLAGDSPTNLSEYVDKYNYAIAHFKNCTVSTPGDFLAYLYRAKCYVDIGKFEKAEELSRVLPADAQKTLQDYIQQERRRWNN